MSATNPITRREALLVTAVLAAMLLAGLWSVGRMNSAHARAMDDGQAWVQSASYAQQIQNLRDKPMVAEDEAIHQDDMTRRIADAVATASFGEKRLIAIEHQAARRIGRTAYLEEPTRLTFKDVSLQQILTMLSALTDDDSRLHVSRLRLTAPRGASDARLWTVDVTVTYLIYEPAQKN